MPVRVKTIPPAVGDASSASPNFYPYADPDEKYGYRLKYGYPDGSEGIADTPATTPHARSRTRTARPTTSHLGGGHLTQLRPKCPRRPRPPGNPRAMPCRKANILVRHAIGRRLGQTSSR